MSVNKELAVRFQQISDMLELLGEDKFRVNAHARAARSIKDYPADLAALAGDRKALTAIDGIGAKTADKIIEFVQTGRIAEHEELEKKVPAGLLAILGIPGLGPKTVKLMWDQLGIVDVAGLKKAIDDASILTLPRMGQKTIDNIKESMAPGSGSARRCPSPRGSSRA
jgi:DNA polymerase (family 10)